MRTYAWRCSWTSTGNIYGKSLNVINDEEGKGTMELLKGDDYGSEVLVHFGIFILSSVKAFRARYLEGKQTEVKVVAADDIWDLSDRLKSGEEFQKTEKSS